MAILFTLSLIMKYGLPALAVFGVAGYLVHRLTPDQPPQN